MRVYVCSGDGNSYEYTWNGGTSTWQKVVMGNNGVTGVKVQCIPARAKDDGLVRVYTADAGGGVNEFNWSGTWQSTRLGAATAYMYGLAAGDGLNDGTVQVYGSSYDGQAYMFRWISAAPITVPNVVNFTQPAASTAIVNAGLVVGTLTNASSATVPSGSVISQNPAAGTSVAQATAVSLVISTGAPIPVPDVVNQTQVTATTTLVTSGFIVGTVTNAAHATIPANSVISQSPVAGTPRPPGSAVSIVVSTGQFVTVPSVVNITEAAATTAITGAGLIVGTVSTDPSPTVPSGSIISQNPAAGSQAMIGSAVNLVRSTGPQLVVVPSVANQTQAQAAGTLGGAGLNVGAISSVVSLVPVGLVVSQNPLAGSSAPSGSAVALVLSLGGVAVPNVVNQTQANASLTLTGAGLMTGAITNANSATVPAGSVISQNPVAGTVVAGGSAVALVVSLGPVAAGPTVDITTSSDGRGTRTTPAFSTTGRRVLVAFALSDGPTSSGQRLTVSGAGLTWTLVRRVNARLGSTEIWTATSNGPLSNATVTAMQRFANFDQSLTVVTFINASGIGASNIANGASGGSSVSLTTTAAASLVYAGGNDWDRAAARTVGSGQLLVRQWVDTGADNTFWVQTRSAVIPAAGTPVQMNVTAPTNDRWNFAAVEIRP